LEEIAVGRDLEVLARALKIEKDPERVKKPSAEDSKILTEAQAIRRDPERMRQVRGLAKEKLLESERNKKKKTRERAVNQPKEKEKKRAQVSPLETAGKNEPANLPEGVSEVENPAKLDAANPQAEDSYVDNLSEGAFATSRSLFKSEVWVKDPLYLKAWVWMFGKANHQGVKRGGYFYQRGELSTTYDEISKDGLKYRSNREWIYPSLKTIRYMLQWFISEGMIEVEPLRKRSRDGTRPSKVLTGADTGAYTGLRIKIINYDTYQNFDNYKGRHKGINKGRTGAELGHNNNNEINKKIYVEGSNELRLATLLLKEIRKHKPNYKLNFKEPALLQKWAKHVDLTIRVDGIEPGRIEKVIV
jgi:hypothetical protein